MSNVWKPKEGALPPEKMEVLRDLNEAFHGDRNLIEAYIEKFGWSKVISPNVRIINRECRTKSEFTVAASSNIAARFSAEEKHEDALKSAFYEVNAKCVFCGEELRPSLLRSKALIIIYSYKCADYPLFVPEALSAMQGYMVADPLPNGVIKCPKCLFAAITISSFQTESAVSGVRGILVKLGERKLATLRKFLPSDMENRQRIGTALESFNHHPDPEKREKAEAYRSYLIASHCSEILAEHDPTEYYRAADALLCAAKLASDLEQENEERHAMYKALPFLERSYEEGSVSALPVYLIGVLHYHLGDPTSSRTWIGRVLTDRGKLVASSKYKRYCENLNEHIKSEKGVGAGL